MAEITQTRQLPAEFIEALGKTYGDQLTTAIGGLKDLDPSKFMVHNLLHLKVHYKHKHNN